MKKILITLAVILALAAVAVVTCPDRQDHKEAIMSVINEKINESVSQEDDDVALLASAFGSRLVGYFFDNMLVVDNHFVYSTGTIRRPDGERKTLSIGVFGHVFTFDKEDIDNALNNLK